MISAGASSLGHPMRALTAKKKARDSASRAWSRSIRELRQGVAIISGRYRKTNIDIVQLSRIPLY